LKIYIVRQHISKLVHKVCELVRKMLLCDEKNNEVTNIYIILYDLAYVNWGLYLFHVRQLKLIMILSAREWIRTLSQD